MRVAMAFGLLFVTTGLAVATEARPLPDYFAASWDAVAAAPLAALAAPAPKERPVVGVARDLPPIILTGVPTPPERPVVTPGAAAYASMSPDVDLPGPVPGAISIPLPVPRPRAIDRADTSEPAADAVPPPAALQQAAPAQQRPADPAAVIRPASLPGKEGLVIRPEAKPSAPGTKVAMLGGLPGAGMAINALARMAPLPPIVKGACSVGQPYKVSALGPNGRTALVPAATLDVGMVQGLVKWEAEVQAAAKKALGEPIVALKVAASYDCRTMNHRRRTRLSEHAHANAIDIAGYVTASGKEITVARDFYSRGASGAFLKLVHADTCDVFQVVLGPGSDGMHENHFHMDMGGWKACR